MTAPDKSNVLPLHASEPDSDLARRIGRSLTIAAMYPDAVVKTDKGYLAVERPNELYGDTRVISSAPLPLEHRELPGFKVYTGKDQPPYIPAELQVYADAAAAQAAEAQKAQLPPDNSGAAAS